MKFKIQSEAFCRIANAAAHPESENPQLACVRLEHRDGKAYAVATSKQIIAIEFLGATDEPEGFINVPSSFAARLGSYDDELTFSHWPEFTLGFVTVDELPGEMLYLLDPDNAEPMFSRWFDVIPRNPPRVDRGFMYINGEEFTKLVASSPTGCFAFAEVLDNTRVTIVRDIYADQWLGAFVPSAKNRADIKPATVPTWMP